MQQLTFGTAVLVAILNVGQASAGLIINGGFESGTLSGWSATGPVSVVGSFPHSGSYQALATQDVTFATLSQTVNSGTGAFDLNFYLLGYSGEFKVLFDGATVLDKTSWDPLIQGVYKSYDLNVTSSHASPTLEFDFKSAANYFRLDDVNLTASGAVPEPSSFGIYAILLGIGGLVGWSKRRSRTTAAV